MPNMRAILESQPTLGRFRLDRWRLVARILFGVTQDGGGVIWVPGRGPVPVDPGGPMHLERVTPEVRDVLAALAVHELAGLSDDVTSASSMRKASLSAVMRATEKLASRANGKR